MQIIIGILTAFIIFLIGFLYNRHRKLKGYYEVICKKSSSLKPYDVLGERVKKYGFHKYYYTRSEDESIKEKIEREENVLIVGSPLAGKTRAIYQSLINLNKPHNVIIPAVVDITTKDLLVPDPICFWRKIILVLDDLDKFIEKQHFIYLLQEYLKRNTIIIASCRSGPEYKKLCKKLETELTSIFDEPIEMPKIQSEEGEKIAKQTGKDFPPTFDGNIGSIFLPLESMRERFRSCSAVEKCVLRSIKRLYYAGIYREREIFFLERIKRVCKHKEIEMKEYEWDEKLKELKNQGFIEIMKKDHVWAEETYLEFIIEDDFSSLNNLNEMMVIFSNDTEALFSLGNQACYIGLIDIQRAKYMRVAIKTFDKILKIRTLERFPIQYANTHNNLGNAYATLAEVENKADNCKKAIKAFKKTLKVRTLEKFPIQYANTNNNIAVAYSKLAEVEKKAQNCNRAIEACEEALKVYIMERFPMQYAGTQNNLGAAYCRLAEVEEKAENCKKAINAYEEALKVRTLELFPMQYATTQNNLGAAYSTLAEVEEKVEEKIMSIKNAIEAFEAAIKIRTIQRFPIQYAMTQTNIGVAYGMLARVKDKAENCKNAIDSFNKSLNVYTLERFPIQYAYTQNNLGNAYGTLAVIENKADNCKNAMEAYKKALKVFTKEEFTEPHNLVQGNLRRLIDFCEGE